MVILSLFVIMGLVLVAPFSVKKVEEELEIFLFIMGCLALTITRQWDIHLVKEGLLEPVKITLAVFIAGLLFRSSHKAIAHNVNRISDAIGLKPFAFVMVMGLGLFSSVITAIIAALILAEMITYLTLDRKHELYLVILSCFSIGFGAALTPIGEPLSTITIAKLKALPYNADFFFLLRQLWFYILLGMALFGFLAALLMPNKRRKNHGLAESKEDSLKDIGIRAVKVYFFVMALVFLGRGFKPIIDEYISKIPYQGLYWINMVSAVLDNATLAAAEINPAMGLLQIKSALLGLLIAGGMLIPGNIPNIISAGKLKIKSSEWAKFGLPVGIAAMALFFFLLLFIG